MIPPPLEQQIQQQIYDTRSQAVLSWAAAREAEDKNNARHQEEKQNEKSK